MKVGITLWKKVVGLVTGMLFAFLIVGTVIASENEGAISASLGAKTFEVIDNSDGTEDTDYFKSDYANLAELKAVSDAMGEQAEAEGAVLLKNDNNALPLLAGSRDVTLFGITSVDPVYGGTGSGAVDTSSAPTFASAMEASGFTVNDDVWTAYEDLYAGDYGRTALPGSSPWSTNGFTIGEAPFSDVVDAAGASFATYGDAAIVVIGRVGGEGSDMKSTGLPDDNATAGDYLRLSANEIGLLEGLAARKGTDFDRIIVLLNSANQVEASFINDADYKIDAALWIGGVGQVGLYAVADILAGEVNPSGHLSDMFWADHSYNPVLANFGAYAYSNSGDFEGVNGSSFGSYVVYQEGVYLGYRYAETRYEDIVMSSANAGSFTYDDVVSYPFGYGLSYSSFEYSNFEVSRRAGVYTASVEVTNTGSVAGKDAAQFYVQKPYTDYDRENGIEKPSIELVDFAKTDVLAPGDSQVVTVEIDQKYFTSYDANGAETFVLDAGTYYVAVGHDAHDALNNVLAAKGFDLADGMTAAGDASMVADYTLGFDADTYSVSSATGKPVTNLFDQADINRSEEAGNQTVTYLSRDNWAGTVDLVNHAEVVLTQAMVDKLVGQTTEPDTDDTPYPAYEADNGLKLVDMRVDSEGNPIAFDDPAWDLFMDQLSWDETAYLLSTGLRKTGVIESIAKPETVDHNGPSGLTQPFSYGPNGLANLTDDPLKDSQPMCYPSNGILAATFNKELARAIGTAIGEEGLWAGYSGLYGTGANMHRSPYEGRAFEYYSEDPILTGFIVSEESAGIQSKGVYVYLKHFALNEQENNRTGIATFTNEQALREIYLRAFEIPVEDAGVKNVMAAFNRVGLEIAPNSDALLNGWLRDEAGMTGFVVTDFYMAYGGTFNRAQTIINGCDLPDGDVDPSALDVYKEDHGAVAQAMRLAAKRVLYTVAQSNAMNGISSGTQIVQLTPTWVTALRATDIVFGLAFVGVSTLMVLEAIKKSKKA